MSTNDQPSLSLEDDNQAVDIRLIAADGGSFTINKNYAMISKLIKTSLESDPTATEIPLQDKQVSTKVLKEIVDFMQEHKGTEPPIVERPLRSKLMSEVTSSWCASFIDRIGEERQFLYDIVSVSNYMDIQSLLHLSCAKIASLIKGQPLDKIKEILQHKLDQPTVLA